MYASCSVVTFTGLYTSRFRVVHSTAPLYFRANWGSDGQRTTRVQPPHPHNHTQTVLPGMLPPSAHSISAYIGRVRSAVVYQGFPDPQWPVPSQGTDTGGNDGDDGGIPGNGKGNREEVSHGTAQPACMSVLSSTCTLVAHFASLTSYQTLALLLPLLILLTTLLLLLLIFLVFLILLRRSRRGAIALSDHTGPTNLEREDEIDGQGGLAGVEQRWLESAEDPIRTAYLRSKGEWVVQTSRFCVTSCRDVTQLRSRSFCTPQTGKRNTPPILSPPTSLSPSFSPYKKRESAPGRSNRTTNQIRL